MKKNKLMVAGPTEIEDDIRSAASQRMVYNRTAEFSEFLSGIEANLKKLFRTQHDVFIISSSGTGAMEAAVANLLSKGDEVLILSGGTFGQRWYEIADRYGAKCTLLEVAKGYSVTSDEIKDALTNGTKAVFVTANETSTGVIIDLRSIGEVVGRTNSLLVVDAVSSLGSDPLEMDEWKCDVVISSSQKALALPPGLSFIAVNGKAWDRIEQSDIPKYYFDLRAYRENIKRGQTPFTPPISLLYQLDARLKRIMEIGLDRIISGQRKKSDHLCDKLREAGLQVIGQYPSAGVVGVQFPDDIDASKVVEALRTTYSIEITPSPGHDKKRIARIGLFGAIDINDIDHLVESLKRVVEQKTVRI